MVWPSGLADCMRSTFECLQRQGSEVSIELCALCSSGSDATANHALDCFVCSTRETSDPAANMSYRIQLPVIMDITFLRIRKEAPELEAVSASEIQPVLKFFTVLGY